MPLVDCAERDAELVDASEIGLGRADVGRRENARHGLLLHENHADAGRYIARKRAYLRARLRRSLRRRRRRSERHRQRSKSAENDHQNPKWPAWSRGGDGIRKDVRSKRVLAYPRGFHTARLSSEEGRVAARRL